jgi:hypothetical protein
MEYLKEAIVVVIVPKRISVAGLHVLKEGFVGCHPWAIFLGDFAWLLN